MSKLYNSNKNKINFTALSGSKIKAVETQLIDQKSRSTRIKAIVHVGTFEIPTAGLQNIFNKLRNLIRRARDCRQGVSIDICSIPNRVDGRSFYVKNMNYSRYSSVNSQLLKLCREKGINSLEVDSSAIFTVGKDGVHYSYASAIGVGYKMATDFLE